MFGLCVVVFLFPLAFGGHVLPITKSTRDELTKHPLALVKYYAPWCGHCKALAPHYEDAAEELKKKQPPVPLFEVNCDEEKDMCSEAGVQGYPTLKVYNFGEYSEEFDGQRTKSGIVDFMVERSGPPVTEIAHESQLNELLSSDDYVIVLQSGSASSIEEFEKVARKLRKFFRFAYTKDKLLDSSVDSQIKLTMPKNMETKLEDRFKIYEGLLTASDIEKWIRDNAVGLAGIRDKKMQSFFEKPLLVAYTQVNFERDPSAIRYYRNRLLAVAKESKSKLMFALSDMLAFSDELHEMGITPVEGGATVVILGKDGKNYLMENKFGVDELRKFVSEFTAGSLEPYVKSEPIPETQDDSVIKVVGKTFDDIVLDKSKDVLIEFFAPWCGHCKALKPKYEELAKKLSKEKNVVIAAIDATANSFPSVFAVHGYPTIYWVPMDSKDAPVQYQGGREVDDMLKFVARSATKELSYYTRGGEAKQEEL